MAGGGGGVGMVQLKADDPQVHRQPAQQCGRAGERQAVLPPGDPGHPSPRHWPQAGVLLPGEPWHCQRGQFLTTDSSASRPRGRAGQRPGAGLAQVGKGQLFEGDRVRFPSRRAPDRRWRCSGRAGALATRHGWHARRPLMGRPLGLRSWAGEHDDGAREGRRLRPPPGRYPVERSTR